MTKKSQYKVFLLPHQITWLRRQAIVRDLSSSRIVRELIDKAMSK